jgi:Peptidase family S58
VEEGAVGAGTGTVAFGFKGGIGTASRTAGRFTVGVLVQTNFGGNLTINGAPVGRELRQAPNTGDGSCILVIATDAPVDARSFRRMAPRSMFGLARTDRPALTAAAIMALLFLQLAIRSRCCRMMRCRRCFWLSSKLAKKLSTIHFCGQWIPLAMVIGQRRRRSIRHFPSCAGTR